MDVGRRADEDATRCPTKREAEQCKRQADSGNEEDLADARSYINSLLNYGDVFGVFIGTEIGHVRAGD